MVRLYARISGYRLGEFSVPIEKLAPHVNLTKRPLPMILADPIAATADLLGGFPHEMIARIFHKNGLTDDTKVGHFPLLVEEKAQGFLWLWGENLHDQDLLALSIFAKQVAIAVENARLFEKVQNMAMTDDLTGLYNRRGLFEIGNLEFARAVRIKRPFSVIMVDIDHFKRVNDKHGHPIGDQVLHDLAIQLRSATREIDIVGRYGGEEFIFLLSDLDKKGAREMADRLRILVENTSHKTDAGDIRLTISLGVAQREKNTPNLEALLAQADQALYEAKRKGRNRVEVQR